MYKIFFYTIILTALLCEAGCCSHRGAVRQESGDSLRIEYRERIIKIPDTVFIEIPKQTAERTTQDSASHLETDYAVSDARLNPDGSLFHSLANKPQQKAVPTEKEIQQRDSIVYRDRWHTNTVTVTQEVDKPLGWWTQTQIYGFWAAVIFLAYHYRRNIFATLVRVFLKK